MPENKIFLPEGLRPLQAMTPALLRDALAQNAILEAPAARCDSAGALHVDLGPIRGLIPREEAVAPWISGAERDIARLALVGKPVCFTVLRLEADEKGAPTALLSRRAAQERAMSAFLRTLEPGTLLTCRVTHMEPFGAFMDIGCGIAAMLPLERISISRIPHPAARLTNGQKLTAAVLSFDRARRRVTLTLRELLGTWMENASRFAPGDTVPGIVRSIREYGAFVELTPNLSGLADLRDGISEGDRVSVFIRSIRPERMKIKLQIIQVLPPCSAPAPLPRLTADGRLDRWVYSPPDCEKAELFTDFTGGGA